jgi:hypothetical protein
MEDTKTNKTLVNVILDRSGSMNSNRAGTISGYNEYINALRGDKQGEYFVTLIQFDAPLDAPELTVKYEEKPLADVPELKEVDYEPRGNTPLYDAIGECIRRVETKSRSVLTVVITDGLENASKEFSKDSIKRLIAEKEKEGWTFAFLGADIDSYAVGASLGVPVGATANYAKGNEQALYSTLAHSTMQRAQMSRTVGLMAAAQWSVTKFFDDDQRAAMGGGIVGGRPAAPSGFPNPPKPVSSPRRPWSVSK